MSSKVGPRVHLDHLIPRASLRWVKTQPETNTFLTSHQSRTQALDKIEFRHIDAQRERYGLFPLLRKPDFQRETSAWTPEQCAELLESIYLGLIVPSLIVWRSTDNEYVYLLDGAHRVSVLRAWILDDWGDKADEGYYERHEFESEILEAARMVRSLVKVRIGSYEDILRAGDRYLKLTDSGTLPQTEMSESDIRRGQFYLKLIQNQGFHVQEVYGTYEAAETSFLRINRTGQRLDDWEITLIQNRNSSLARSVMSIANGGSGRFWPEDVTDPLMRQRSAELPELAKKLHHTLFVPPLQTPIKDANVPFVASTRYFPKHAYLLELLPVLAEEVGAEVMFASDRDASAEVVVQKAHTLMLRIQQVFEHLTGSSNNSKSLSVVPLFYFYTKSGRYVRSQFYGFVTWLMSGSAEQVRTRKVIFCAHRERYEQVVFEHNIPGAITDRVGSGVRAINGTVQFHQRLFNLLNSDKSSVENDGFRRKLEAIMKDLTSTRTGARKKEGRQFDDTAKTTMNMRELFKSAVRCEICGGILDLRAGVQYDHKFRFADTHITDPDTGRPTHPFCNNMRDAIEPCKNGTRQLFLPDLSPSPFVVSDLELQPSLWSLFSGTSFPDEPSFADMEE